MIRRFDSGLCVLLKGTAASILLLALMSCGSSDDSSPAAGSHVQDDPETTDMVSTPDTGTELETVSLPGTESETETEQEQEAGAIPMPDPDDMSESGSDMGIEAIYMGELDSSNVVSFDLTSAATEFGVQRFFNFNVSADGTNVRVQSEKIDDSGNSVIAYVDTLTGEPSLFADNVSAQTRILFDGGNKPITAFGLGCLDAQYDLTEPLPLIDLNAIFPPNVCIQDTLALSSNGDVIIVVTYERDDSSANISGSQKIQAYTISSGSIHVLPDAPITQQGVALSVRLQNRIESDSVSQNGRYVYLKTLWEGLSDTGDTLRYTGGVLWDTLSGQWSTRALEVDERECVFTDRVTCEVPYEYLLASENSRLISQVPTTQRALEAGDSRIVFNTTIQVSGSDEPAGMNVEGLDNLRLQAVGPQGRVVALQAFNGDDATPGFQVASIDSGQRISLDRAVRQCVSNSQAPLPANAYLEDENDPASACGFLPDPFTTVDNPASFSVDGTVLLLKSISRFAQLEQNRQSVRDFIYEIDSGELRSLPQFADIREEGVSADGRTLVDNGSFPYQQLTVYRW